MVMLRGLLSALEGLTGKAVLGFQVQGRLLDGVHQVEDLWAFHFRPGHGEAFSSLSNLEIGGGGAMGAGASAGGEASVGFQQGRLPTGSSLENSVYAEITTPVASMTAAATQSGPAGGVSADLRGRTSTGGGAYAIIGTQATYTIATPALGCR